MQNGFPVLLFLWCFPSTPVRGGERSRVRLRLVFREHVVLQSRYRAQQQLPRQIGGRERELVPLSWRGPNCPCQLWAQHQLLLVSYQVWTISLHCATLSTSLGRMHHFSNFSSKYLFSRWRCVNTTFSFLLFFLLLWETLSSTHHRLLFIILTQEKHPGLEAVFWSVTGLSLNFRLRHFLAVWSWGSYSPSL